MTAYPYIVHAQFYSKSKRNFFMECLHLTPASKNKAKKLQEKCPPPLIT